VGSAEATKKGRSLWISGKERVRKKKLIGRERDSEDTLSPDKWKERREMKGQVIKWPASRP
jgi:hypothetical protein